MKTIDADSLLSMIGNANGSVSCKTLAEYITTTAVDVIHCKDCKYYYKTYSEPYCALWSRQDTALPKETDFCSWAEKKK